MADVVKGGAFAVVAMENSTATDHPTGTCVPPAGSESVVCEAAAGDSAAAAATSEEDTQTGSEEDTQTGSEEDNQTGSESEG